MREVQLTADIYCTWMGDNPAYRVYVDGDLLTERTYLWDNKQEYVREHLLVNLSPGRHEFRIERCSPRWILCDYRVKNFTVDGVPTTITNNQFTITE